MIGIYGGTFDPIHNGHLHVIKELLASQRVERIIVVPSGEPLLRDRPIASAQDRLAMCRAAISGIDQSKEYNGRIEVSAIEIERNGPSFAIETVRELISLHPGKEFGWIIGSDAFRKIDQWHESDQLKEMVSFIVIERPEQGRDADEEFDLVEIDALEISATEIRARLIKRESIYELVPPAVSSYIESKGLYVSA